MKLLATTSIVVYVFLYVPILLLVALSFNQSRLSTSWTGFTFDWYIASSAHDQDVMRSAWYSLEVSLEQPWSRRFWAQWPPWAWRDRRRRPRPRPWH